MAKADSSSAAATGGAAVNRRCSSSSAVRIRLCRRRMSQYGFVSSAPSHPRPWIMWSSLGFFRTKGSGGVNGAVSLAQPVGAIPTKFFSSME
jgi:hypothetical protein